MTDKKNTWLNALDELQKFTLENYSREPSKTEIQDYKKNYWKAYRKNYAKEAGNKNRITIKFSAIELKEIDRASKKYGFKKSTLIREIFFAYLRQDRLLPESIEQKLNELISEIRKIGININQVVRLVHTKGYDTIGDYNFLLEQLKRIEDEISIKLKNDN